ncbi:MAG: hypothetical protein ACOCP8_01910 [archaeon]
MKTNLDIEKNDVGFFIIINLDRYEDQWQNDKLVCNYLEINLKKYHKLVTKNNGWQEPNSHNPPNTYFYTKKDAKNLIIDLQYYELMAILAGS